MLKEKSLTLLELLVAIILVAIVGLGITTGAVYFVAQVNASIERQNINTQIDYALEDMKLRCMSAISTDTIFSYTGDTKSSFVFRGEKDIYTIKPDDTSDTTKTWYEYYVNANEDLVLKTCTSQACSAGPEEVLVEKKFKPEIEFTYTEGDEPSFITVTIKAQSIRVPVGTDKELYKTDGIRFWFIGLVE